MPSVKEIAWVAGILEGEGTFSLIRGRLPSVSLSMSDSDIIERVRVLVDPTRLISVTADQPRKDNKPRYTVTLNGTRAIQWIMTIYPLMGIRRKARIRHLLEVWKTVEMDKSRRDPSGSRKRQSLALKLRRNGYSDSSIEVAKILQMRGLTDEQILLKLEELKTAGIN